MSTKNFVSYGDAETLFTEVGEKIGEKGGKLYLHHIMFQLRSASSLYEVEPDSDAFINNNYNHYLIGRCKYSSNGNWERFFNDTEPSFEWRDDYPQHNLWYGGCIRLYFLSTISSQFTSWEALYTQVVTRKAIFIPMNDDNADSQERFDEFMMNHNNMYLHGKEFLPGDWIYEDPLDSSFYRPELKLYLKIWMTDYWSDTVTVWA